ncbi:MAG: PAS domain S-box protein [Actinomycetota bacterium]
MDQTGRTHDPSDEASAQQAGLESDARSILDTAHEAFVSMDAGGFITDWNRQAEVTLGWTRDEAVGRVLADTIIPERFRTDHWDGLQKFLETGAGPVLGKRLELVAIHREGHEIPIEITISALHDGARHSFHAFLHDISARKRNERYLAAQHAVANALAEADSVAEAAPKLLAALGESLGWETGGWWEVDEDAQVLRCRDLWCAPDIDAAAFLELSRTTAFERGVGLPGRVWASGEAASVADVLQDSNFPRADAAAKAGLHAAICLPVLRRDEVRGAIEFFTRESSHRPEELVELMESLSNQIGRFFTVLEERAA